MQTLPDIVLLVLDTQRADRLSCYGYPRETSPRLDALTGASVRFVNAISPAQWTIPAHASIFTGLYPSQHGLTQFDMCLPATIPTLAERLRRAGYCTASFSNNPLVGMLANGLERGFERSFNYEGLLNWPHRRGSSAGRQRELRLLCLSPAVQGRIFALPRLLRLSFSPLWQSLWQTMLRFKGNLKGDTARSLADAARLLDERGGLERGQPVFCFINLMGAHPPLEPPQWALERLGIPIGSGWGRFVSLQRWNARIYRDAGPLSAPLEADWSAILNGLYDAEVAAQDELVGQFVDRLQATSARRTLLIVTADHGEHLGEKQLLGHAFASFNTLLRVPLLIHDLAAEQTAGTVVTNVVSTRRLFHTILDAAQIATPAESALALTGVDGVEPVVLAEAAPPLLSVEFVGYRHPGLLRRLGYERSFRAVYGRGHKLIAADGQPIELYAQDDSSEAHNLLTAQPALTQDLAAHFQDLSTAFRSTEATASHADWLVVQRLKQLGYWE